MRRHRQTLPHTQHTEEYHTIDTVNYNWNRHADTIITQEAKCDSRVSWARNARKLTQLLMVACSTANRARNRSKSNVTFCRKLFFQLDPLAQTFLRLFEQWIRINIAYFITLTPINQSHGKIACRMSRVWALQIQSYHKLMVLINWRPMSV